ncbi:Glu-tRNA(Gln) amidotransferase subunit GatE [Candidatus Micrarchaeota archaeon]|nr:Glu-tRNA(Gln) amidotransferase subunit GatE [Candidatus Micrarchaeota archaeon]
MKIGLELHQRLDTNKLFCNCSSKLDDEEPNLTLVRRLHPVFSELGEIDEASRIEYTKRKVFEYQVFRNNNCLVETDEEPPHPLNLEALKTVLNIALQLHASPVDEVHIMRKMVIDGSNTSGFQRTAIIALDGHLDTPKGLVRISTMALEEESAGIVSASSSKTTYRLDRLGIPLIEITTAPDIKDADHLKEVAEKLGMILRATGKVARGLGTVRQDVNISTGGGARVEIKGAQDLKTLPLLVETEQKRQLELVKILAELRQRKAIPIKKHAKDVTDIFKKTEAKLIKNSLDSGAFVLAQKLQNHAGILGKQIQKGKRYGTELSDYAKLAGVKGIIHSDESLSKYGISESEEKALREGLHAKEEDAFVLIVAPKEQANKAMDHVIFRANMDFVPEETRRANPDGTTNFMRPLPGRARLYPETDIPPVPVTKEFLSSIEKTESLDEKQHKLEKMLNKEMANKIIRSRHLHLFERIVETGADPMLVATTIENTIISLRREGVEFKDLEEPLLELFEEYAKGTFVKAAIPDVLKFMAKGARVEAILKVYRLQKITSKDLEKLVIQNSYDMKTVMQKYRLQVDPQEVAEIIKKKRHSEYV